MNVTVAKPLKYSIVFIYRYIVTCDKIYQVKVIYFDQEISMWMEIYKKLE